ncbi:hypothetical protein C6P46_000679 [Rhodotorula mucilaginosa]|uniref:Uncharacterized protein n=1 Tax=Rhodotorula mucilaginosa TaxID=5537 RepID=A0A9P6VV47_RHOMI|nr:hypothetical protein C6P46_000679 [Rhodotorula mucilaginosa]
MFATAATTIPTPMIKRSRDQVDGDPSPGKRVKTNAMVEEERARELQAALSAPPPSPTPHWSTALAKQQQRALEMMQGGAIDQEDVEMGGESAAGPDGVLPSNPQHPWNHVSMALGGDGSAPRMEHQHSASGNSSSADSSLPSTPLDLPFNEQWDMSSSKPIQTPSYPSPSNPTSFTNFNGTTVVFSTSPPLSVYPPPPATMSTPQQQNPLHAAAGFPMHAWSASTSGVMRMEGPSMGAGVGAPPQSPEVVRELNLPSYGWDLPKQSNTLNMGAHLV